MKFIIMQSFLSSCYFSLLIHMLSTEFSEQVISVYTYPSGCLVLILRRETCYPVGDFRNTDQLLQPNVRILVLFRSNYVGRFLFKSLTRYLFSHPTTEAIQPRHGKHNALISAEVLKHPHIPVLSLVIETKLTLMYVCT
jgi:hypothetical protein